MSETGIEQFEDGLIILKCRTCKTPTLFKLEGCHEADDHDYRAKSNCRGCIKADPLKGLVYRKVVPQLIENQKIKLGCHVPEWAVRTESDHSGGSQ